MTTADDNDLIAALVRERMDELLDNVEDGDQIGYTVMMHARHGNIVLVNIITPDAADTLERSRAACAVAIEQIDATP